jgi:biotin carboxylase
MSMTGAGEKALEYCWERGYAVTLVSRVPERYEPVLRCPTRLVRAETNDFDEVERTVRRIDAGHRIDGVTTTHDLYVPQAALGAEVLNLPGMPYRAAATVRNKYRMRSALARHHPHLCPRFRVVGGVDDALATAREWGFPVIAKPQNANNSWGVRRLDSEDDLVSYMGDTARWDTNVGGQRLADGVLMESYIDGRECSVETVQGKGGRIQLIGVTGKELAGAEYGSFIERGIFFPADVPEVPLLFREVSGALQTLGVDCGVIHTECRVHDGGVKILEVNPRVVGDMTGSHMIELALGASPIALVVEAALGAEVVWRPTRQRAAGKFGVCMPETGVFGGIANLEPLRSLPGVAHIRVMAEVGQRYFRPPRSNLDLIARIVCSGATPGEALRRAKDAVDQASVRVLD